MTILMYVTGCYGTDIKEVTVDRVTDASVFINGERKARDTEWRRFHVTKDDAVSFLIGKAERAVAGYAANLARADKELSELKRKYNIGA